MNHFKNFNTMGWILFEKFLRIALGFFISAAVARYLGPSQHGSLSIALGIVAIFIGFAGMGADHINIHEFVIRKDANLRKFFSSILVVRLIWASFCFLALCIYISVFSWESWKIYSILIWMVPITALSIYGNRIQAIGGFRNQAILGIFVLVCAALARMYGIGAGKDISFFAVVVTGETMTLSFAYAAWLLRKGHQKSFFISPDVVMMKEYFLKCIPTAFSAGLVSIFLRMEIFVIGYMIGDASAGQWAVANMMVAPWSIVGAAILPIVNRNFSLLEKDELRSAQNYSRLIRVVALISLFAICINWLAIILVIPWLLGSAYSDAYFIMMISSFAIPFLFFGGVQDIWIAQKGNTKVVLKKIMLGLPISLGLLWLFVGCLGAEGAAISMIISYMMTTILMNIIFDKEYFKVQMLALGVRYAWRV